jgi:putative DNA primase/helicase
MTVYPNSDHRTLSDSHRAHLAASAIDPAVARERGTFSARRGADVPQDGGKLPKKPGIVFTVHTLDGNVFYRLRPNHPGRLPRYMQPKGHPNRLDVHPRQHERIKQAGGMKYVTEGEKKVDAGVGHGLLMVGLSGVWNGQKDKELIPDWKLLPLAGERYSILFDSDIESNPNVQMAADRQARLLREQGADVYITLLPPAPDGSKQGLDDFFANGGTAKQ